MAPAGVETAALAAVSADHELERVAEVGAAWRVETRSRASRCVRRRTVPRLEDEARVETAVGVVRDQLRHVARDRVRTHALARGRALGALSWWFATFAYFGPSHSRARNVAERGSTPRALMALYAEEYCILCVCPLPAPQC